MSPALLLLLGAGVALANYTLPYQGPGQPFLPPAPRYSSPAYLPPARDHYSERQGYYSERQGYYREGGAPAPPHYYPTTSAPTAATAPAPAPALGPAPAPAPYPGRPAGFTRVQGGAPGGRAQLHAVLDYDEDYYEDDDGGSTSNGGPQQGSSGGQRQAATPIQGPIFLKNGSVPVVPLYSYPVLNNGTFVQIPILWSALSVALGLEVRGQLIRGVPCVKRFHQLFCPTAGNTYPIERIEHFIDENKALMKRMYGDFTVFTEYGVPGRGKRGAPGVPDPLSAPEPRPRRARQAGRPNASAPPFLNPNQGNSSGRIDACESKMEIVTPYWALNSAGKVRAVVNTMHFEQAIHQEVCSKTQTSRCAGECGCEQKYKWHRLLAFDPDQDCSGIFMDWFLFPSCCVCRCSP